MKLFKLYLVIFFLCIATYTLSVASTEGWNFIPFFLINLNAVNWSGQFNLDFGFDLSLSAIWVAWRHQFSPTGFILETFALIGGGLFFAPYLIYSCMQAKGDPKVVLLGLEQ